MSKKSSFAVIIASILSLGIFANVAATNNKNVVETNAAQVTYTNGDGATYYNGISSTLTGESLLTALRSLNSQKRKSTVGYSAMGTDPSGKFKYTDYDPATVKYDENGQPYGTSIISFYSGNSTNSFNREHVWPNTHGGNLVEADIHMPRPTIPSENGSRGHSFYIEGMKSKNNTGWDPAMESFGEESYRGDSARIIFYSMVASSQLTLTDDKSRSSLTKNTEMGIISDMLKWNLNYPVLQREKNRNEGAEYLQGNRNPFIDHPEYACKIWGNTNDATKAICQGHTGEDEATLRAVGTFTKSTYEIGESLDPSGMTVIYNPGGQGEADVDVTSQVTWEPTTFTGSGKVEVYAKYLDLVASCGTVTVNGETIVTNPVVGTKYKLGFENTGTQKQLFVTGDMASNGYALATTTDKDASADVTLEAATGGYYIKIEKQGGSAQYLDGFANGSYVNLRLLSEPSCVWQFNSTYNTFTTEISGCTTASKNGTNFIGSYSSYEDLRISSISYAGNDNNYPAHFYPTDGGHVDPPGEKQLVISGTLYTDEYYVGDEFDPAGLKVNYIVGSESTDVTYDVTWSLSTLDTAGEFELTASYDGLTAKYDGLVTVEHFEELQASGTLKKTTYYLNDWIETAGVTISYICDGELTNVTSKVEWMPMQFTELGETYVVVYYCSAYGTDLYAGVGTVNVIEEGTSSEEMSSEEESSSEQSSEELSSEEASSEDVSSEQSSEEYSSEEVSQSEQQSSSEALSSEETTSTQIESSEQSSEQTSVSESESKQESSSSSGSEDLPEKGGCKASIGGSSSIVFIGGFVALFFAIRHLIRIKKEEK